MRVDQLSLIKSGLFYALKSIVLSLAIFAAQFVFCADVAWEKVKDGDGITVYSRPVSGARFSEFKTETIFEANLQQCAGLFMSVPNMPKWMYNAKKVELESATSELDRKLYMALHLPFPLHDRDAHVKSWLMQNEDKSVVYTMELIPTEEKSDGYVHLKTLHVRIILTPISPQQTKVVYVALIDPGGNIPSWANYLFSDAPYESLKNARKIVSETKNNLVVASIKNGF